MKSYIILAVSVVMLISVWLYGNWVVRQDKKEGRKSDNYFGM